jgi:hypothetical protein
LYDTLFTLFPKDERVVDPNKFLPISLYNVIYKIISKVVAIFLNPLLPTLITPEQYGYVEGRQILDSILLVHEVSYSLKITENSGMLIKLNMSKSLDNLSRKYIKEILLDLGFIGIGLDGSWT